MPEDRLPGWDERDRLRELTEPISEQDFSLLARSAEPWYPVPVDEPLGRREDYE